MMRVMDNYDGQQHSLGECIRKDGESPEHGLDNLADAYEGA